MTTVFAFVMCLLAVGTPAWIIRKVVIAIDDWLQPPAVQQVYWCTAAASQQIYAATEQTLRTMAEAAHEFRSTEIDRRGP
jgi:hypothetical protein